MKNFLLAFAIVSAMQFTDYRFFEIKIGDIISIITIIAVFTIYKNVPFPPLYTHLIIIFTLCFLVSLLTLSWIKIYPPSEVSSILKSPGWISLSRYIQYIGCVFFALFIHSILHNKSISEQHAFILIIDKLMFAFGVFFIFFWVLGLAGIKNPFVYASHVELSTNRLSGGYVEGGPFGLLYAFYAMVRFKIFGLSLKWLLLVTAIIVASESKAGLFFFIVAFVYLYVFTNRMSLAARCGLLAICVLFFLVSTQLFDMAGGLRGYQNSIEEIERVVSERPDDGSLVMGRIAGSFIGPKMFYDNMLFGVGFGNYSLARNNPEYLGIFPAVSGWDLDGLGGIATFGLESGIIGVALLFAPIIMFWLKKDSSRNKQLIAFFVLAQIFGVQLHFQYPWFALGMVTAFDRPGRTTRSNNVKLIGTSFMRLQM